MATFDLSVKIVTAKQKAWVVHAGNGQQHSLDFLSRKAIFLEAPQLNFENVDLKNRKQVRMALRRAQAFDKHLNTSGSVPPSAALTDYSDSVFENSSDTALVGGLSRMFGVMDKGDLIMSPGTIPGEDFNTPAIHFGEVTDKFKVKDILSGSKPKSQRVSYRKVAWLKSVPRKDITLYLDRKVGKPPALREIAIERDTEEILQHAYKSYIFENTSSSLIEASKYDGSDFMTLTDAQRLIATLVAAHHVFSGQSAPNQIPNIDDFVRNNFKDAAIDNIVVDFASPGFWRLIGASTSMAAFVGLGIAIFASDVDLQSLPKLLTIVNSASIAGEVEQDTQANMQAFVRSLDHIVLQDIRKTAHEAKQNIGLTSSVLEVGP